MLSAQFTGLGMLNAEFQLSSCGSSERVLCAICVNSSIWVGMSTGVVNVIDSSTRTISRSISSCKDRILTLLLVDDTHVWFIAKNSIYSVNCVSAKPAKVISRHSSDIVALIKVDVKTLASADANGMITFWNPSGRKLGSVRMEQPVFALHAAFDSIWVSCSRSIHLVSIQTRSIISGVQIESNQAKCLIDIGNELWISQNDNTILVYSYNDGALSLTKTLEGHTGRVGSLCVVDDTVWSGSFDRSIIIWDARTKECLMELKGDGKKVLLHNDTVHSIFLVGDTVWSASRDNKICIWRKEVSRP